MAGDATVVADLFNCYGDALGRFLVRRCGAGPDAEDALQDAFEAAARSLGTYRGDAPTSSWLFRVAANACTRMRRGMKNDPSLHAPLDESPMAELDPLDVDSFVAARIAPLKEGLLGLAETDRAVLLLRDAEGLTAQETAEALGLSVAAVKSRLHRARARVREALKASGIEAIDAIAELGPEG